MIQLLVLVNLSAVACEGNTHARGGSHNLEHAYGQ